ncbi:Transcription initiation factor IIE subunit beta [Astathelohania contejeani]|uniref:Transcription initiation factor IIE subunit beta n=1 Tax=Astathelohania contejeani TaxID=164912 RepID=A0ABQ7I1C0_9MICR|nr:Transcription initiation factor IIE subunit beta [Thelohania contejeani]
MSIYTNVNDSQKRHINSYIHSILEILKSTDRYYSFEEINHIMKIDLHDNRQLLAALRKNPKIEITTNSMRFKPAYDIETEDDILKYLDGIVGLELNKLKDCRVDITPLIESLKQKKKIFIIKDMDNSEIIFKNDTIVDDIDPVLKTLWKQVKVPIYQDLVEELNNAGLKLAPKNESKPKGIIITKTKTKKNRRKIKLTNTHIKELNIQ